MLKKILKLITPKKIIRIIWLYLFFAINNKDFLFKNGKFSGINLNFFNPSITVIYIYILTVLDICIHKNYIEHQKGFLIFFITRKSKRSTVLKKDKIKIPYYSLSTKTNKKIVDKLKRMLELDIENNENFIITNIEIKFKIN